MKIEKPELNPTFFYGPVISYEFNGNISRDKNHYRFRYSLTFKSGEVYRTQKSGFRTMAEATKAKEQLIADLTLHRHTPFKYTVKEVFDYWLYWHMVEEVGISYNTFQLYRNVLYNHLLPSLGKNRKIGKVTMEDIIKAVRKIKYPSVKEKACRIIKEVFDYSYLHNYISSNVCLAAYMTLKKEVHRPKKREVLCSVEKIKTLLYLCRRDFEEMYIPLLLSLTLGTRISETIGIKYSDIDFTAHLIYINRQLGRSMEDKDEEYLVSSPLATKTPRGIRYVPVADWVIDEIIVRRARYERDRQTVYGFRDMDYVCCKKDGSPFHRRSFARDFKKLLLIANLPSMHWHDLRHIYATVLKNNSVNMKAVSEYLGHYSPDFTEEVYVQQVEEAYDCSSLCEEWEGIAAPDTGQCRDVCALPFGSEDLLSLLKINDDKSSDKC